MESWPFQELRDWTVQGALHLVMVRGIDWNFMASKGTSVRRWQPRGSSMPNFRRWSTMPCFPHSATTDGNWKRKICSEILTELSIPRIPAGVAGTDGGVRSGDASFGSRAGVFRTCQVKRIVNWCPPKHA